MSQSDYPNHKGDNIEAGDVSMSYSDTEDSAPPYKEKTPLNKQYQALELHQQQAGLSTQGTGTGIDWVPNLERYLQLVDSRFQKGLPCPAVIPQGFPAFVEDPSCWSAKDIKIADIIHALSSEEIKEIENALVHFKGLSTSSHSQHMVLM